MTDTEVLVLQKGTSFAQAFTRDPEEYKKSQAFAFGAPTAQPQAVTV